MLTTHEKLERRFNELRPRLERFLAATRRCSSDDLEDVLSESLLRTLKGGTHLTHAPDELFATWVFKIVMNCHTDLCRKRANKELKFSQTHDENQFDEIVSDPMAQVIDRLEKQAMIAEVVKELSLQQRQILMMRAVGLQMPEIAAHLNLPLPTCKTRWYRIRKIIQRKAKLMGISFGKRVQEDEKD